QFIANNGKLGRSQGCPALPLEKNEKIINLLKGGSCLFIYHPNKYYKKHSSILKNYNESCLAEVLTTLEY
ncbi:MAG TPA: murein L,D-transpeptidase catalytic domain family protein, partial [Chitinophagales bacterium]|nr:murein L,D-transpeptidase catalytic domain family protein [Chitinophagales bacterium]